jgi:hypothetical protein
MTVRLTAPHHWGAVFLSRSPLALGSLDRLEDLVSGRESDRI